MDTAQTPITDLLPQDSQATTPGTLQCLNKEFVRRVARHYHAAVKAQGEACDHIFEVGRLLSLAKAQSPKGRFHKFLEQAFGVGTSGLCVRSLQRYMKGAEILCQELGVSFEYFDSNNATRVSQLISERGMKVNSLRQILAIRQNERTETKVEGQLQIGQSVSSINDGDVVESSEADTSLDNEATIAAPVLCPHFATPTTSSPTAAPLILTPNLIVQAAARILREIDLDPASNSGVPHIPAHRHYRAEENGLDERNAWKGRLYLHPPHDSAADWSRRLVREYAAGHVTSAIALLPARMSEDWFGTIAGTAAGLAIWRGVLHFPAGNTHELITIAEGPFAILFLSHEIPIERFAEEFGAYADLYRPFRFE